MGWSLEKQTWCCTKKGFGCRLANRSTSTVEPHLPHEPPHVMRESPFDCNSSLATWQQSWPAEKKAWCCRVKGVGCDSAFQSTSASIAPARATDVPPTPASPKAGCDLMCSIDTYVTDCRSLILWAARHLYANRPQACSSALALTLKRCPVCHACTYDEIGCSPSRSQTPWQGAAAPTPLASSGHDWATPPRNRLAAETYECETSNGGWRNTWSSGKRLWCCWHEGIACEALSTPQPETTAKPAILFDCNMHGLTEEQTEWCCKYANVGCRNTMSH